MTGGYSNFPGDVELIFTDIIRQYGFKLVSSKFDTAILENNKIQIIFSIIEESMTMSLKRGEKIFIVTDMVALYDKPYFFEWKAQRETASAGLSREDYYKSYLSFYHVLADKYFLNSFVTGIIPLESEYDTMKKEKDEYLKNYDRAWEAVQKLNIKDPIRQKYIFNDQTWVSDMLRSMGEKN